MVVMLQSYTQQGYPFYGRPVNAYPFTSGPYRLEGPQALPPGFQYIPHPSNAPYAIPPPTDGQSAGEPTTRMPRPKHLQTKSVPIKSAMKRAATTSSTPLTRQRTVSNSKQDDVPLTRKRTSSQSQARSFASYHIFVTFRGTNQLVIENLTHPDALSELRQEIFPLWPPGIDSEESRGTVWRVVFANNPWSSSGKDSLLAWEIVSRLFWLLVTRGYTYLTSTNIGSKNPRLVFGPCQPEQNVEFFLGHFSSSGHRLSLINPPTAVIDSLPANLKNAMPRKVASDRIGEDNVLVIELKTVTYGVPLADKTEFITHVLREIFDMGYYLQTAIPMARRGIMGYKSRKELWVFRGNKSTN